MSSNIRILVFFGLWSLAWTAAQWWILQSFNQTGLTPIYDAIITNSTITAIAYSLFYISKNISFTRSVFITPSIILSLSIASAYYIQKFLIYYITTNQTEYYTFFTNTASVRVAFNALMVLSAAILSWIWHYKTSLQEDIQVQTDNEKLLREAELLNLRQQIQPHFLFNSLNSISSLLGSKPEKARQMIQELADFLRGTLKKEENQLISLNQELQHLQLYLNIELVRFGHRLNVNIQAEEACKTMLIPSLLIQPIVENAIKFGLYGTTEIITIGMECKPINKMLSITISNPFDAETSPSNKGEGFGLRSIERRLYLLFMRNDLLKTTITNNVFTAHVLIPQ